MIPFREQGQQDRFDFAVGNAAIGPDLDFEVRPGVETLAAEGLLHERDVDVATIHPKLPTRHDVDDHPPGNVVFVFGLRGVRQFHLVHFLCAHEVRRDQEEDDQQKHNVDQRRDVEPQTRAAIAVRDSHCR